MPHLCFSCYFVFYHESGSLPYKKRLKLQPFFGGGGGDGSGDGGCGGGSAKQCDIETLNYTLSHELRSERSEQASK